MYCHKCGTHNEEKDNFCSNCGEDLKNPGTARWIKVLIPILLSLIVFGGYFVYDLFKDNQELAKNNLEQLSGKPTEVVDEEPEPEVVEEKPAPAPVVTPPAEKVKQADRVTLIKDVQKKVFTVLTSYGHGSGFLYAQGGYVVTNAHVVEGEVDVKIRNISGQEFTATVIGISDKNDIALLHVPDYKNTKPLPVEKNESPVGLEIIAFGSPQGFENSASIGYITGHNRDFESAGFQYKQIYQVDAQIDKGSSGGALVDATSGKVIGINSLLYTSDTSTNFSFSIPLYSVKSYLDGWIQKPMSRDEVLAVSGTYNYYDEEEYEESYDDVDSMIAGQFVQSYLMYLEQALNDNNFTWIEDMLTEEAFTEINTFVSDANTNGNTFDFIENTILGVVYSDGIYYVDMNETYNMYDVNGEVQFFDQTKTYYVVADEYGAFKITKIETY